MLNCESNSNCQTATYYNGIGKKKKEKALDLELRNTNSGPDQISR